MENKVLVKRPSKRDLLQICQAIAKDHTKRLSYERSLYVIILNNNSPSDCAFH